MATDVVQAADFYATLRGTVTARLLRERFLALWPDLSGQTLLGLGYPTPYLRLWRERTRRCVAVMPTQIGRARWPVGFANLSCTAEEDALPFPDLSFDRILVVHGLEGAENARRLLRELWRVLKDDGRLLVVAPNRGSPWAYVEATPFAQGQPYSPRQIGALLAASLFRIERRDTALYLPPCKQRLLLRSAALWERTGRRLAPQFAGVTISEALKDCCAAVPAQAFAPRRRLVLSETV